MNLLLSTHVHCLPITQETSHRQPFNNPPHVRTTTAKNSANLSVAHQLFDEIPIWDTFAWNNLIQTHLTNGDLGHVISTYQQMLFRGVRPDKHTLPRIICATRQYGNLQFGKQLHAQAFKLGNSVSWTMLAKLYLMEDKPSCAIDLFYQMVELADDIDAVALATAIGACGALKMLQHGRNIHLLARIHGLEFNVLVSNSLLKMYLDCDSIKDARGFFDRMPSKDVISWTELIHMYVKKGGINEAFKLFRQMNKDGGLKPDPLTISSILPACGRMAAHKHGKEIHGYVLKNAFDENLIVQNALVDMYVKSGCIQSASETFSMMKEKDMVSWTIMTLGYSLHGQGKLGVSLFREIERNLRMHNRDQITYTAVLHACTTANMVDEGDFYFSCITEPTVAHIALKVALLARAGRLDEATTFVEKNKLDKHAVILRALLDGCRKHHQRKLGKQIIEKLCDLEPLNAENYILLSNWYACNKKWDMVEKLRETMRDMGLRPKKAYSWMEFCNKIHVFGTGDVSHPRSRNIYWNLQCLMKKMEEDGSKPNPDFSFHDVDEERECVPIGHSELLAISFGLISTKAGRTIRITKNLRVCHSCHESAKFISKMVGREIIVKDPYVFHHFKDGCCSCEDVC
ncbi:pentatricopeptide repeat-containing protein DOT4, chloroplastic-like isoform X2 [Benincasa hispida]|uniref:pentatricopeptide repeat-containing protein DOT4, chloroplastic-like isoform X2 n=1 Tax=Benincasa hispida TaxID=102211 RepID=UPI001901FD1E|nr:pentatricopeptide repeat-containing protein DOT4, chloroplastic-like isoform X2 [Benincasa hispida]